MPIDPSIALGFRPPEQPSQLNMLAQAMQLQGLQRQNQLGQLEMTQRQAEMDRQNRLRDFLATNDVRTQEGLGALRKSFPMEAAKIETQMLEPDIKRAGLEKDQAQAGKYKVDAQAAEFKLKQDKITQNLQLLGGVQNPQQAEAWISGGLKSGLLDMQSGAAALDEMRKAAAAGPEGFAQWKAAQQAAGMSIVQQMDQQWKAKDFGLKQDEFKYRQTNDAANRAVTIRGQNMTDARAREANNAGAGKPPAGYVWGPIENGQPSLVPIKGGPADPATKTGGAPTEDERRSAGLAVRMEAALKRVGDVTSTNSSAAKPELAAEITRNIPLVGEPLANTLTSADRQRVETAQIDALDAALTLATGAAYTKEQLKGLSKSYFPQISDDEKTVQDKRERLAQVIETARIRAGRAAGDIERVLNAGPQAKPQGGPAVGAVQDGYRFKGGNPADPKSWEKL